MPTVAMSGADTIVINDRIITDLADGDCVAITFPNDLASVKTGKNGNSIYGLNEMGNQADVVMRVMRGSSDDKFLNGLLQNQRNNFSSFVLLIGQFIKKIGDGKGAVASDTYITSGGVFTKIPEGKTNVEGDAAQSVATYTIKFAKAPRAIT